MGPTGLALAMDPKLGLASVCWCKLARTVQDYVYIGLMDGLALLICVEGERERQRAGERYLDWEHARGKGLKLTVHLWS